jgi:hypothetical protein
MKFTRRAFARPGLLLAVMSAVGAATLLLTAEPVHAPQRLRLSQDPPVVVGSLLPISTDPHFTQAFPDTRVRFEPVWVYGRKVAKGKFWTLADLKPGVHLDGVRLPGAWWPAIHLSRVNLWSFDFSGATLAGAHFTRCEFRFCNFSGADLSHARFWRSYVTDSDLNGTNLAGADLRTAELLGDNLQDARYDRSTRWPAGFRPEEWGARSVE